MTRKAASAIHNNRITVSKKRYLGESGFGEMGGKESWLVGEAVAVDVGVITLVAVGAGKRNSKVGSASKVGVWVGSSVGQPSGSSVGVSEDASCISVALAEGTGGVGVFVSTGVFVDVIVRLGVAVAVGLSLAEVAVDVFVGVGVDTALPIETAEIGPYNSRISFKSTDSNL